MLHTGSIHPNDAVLTTRPPTDNVSALSKRILPIHPAGDPQRHWLSALLVLSPRRTRSPHIVVVRIPFTLSSGKTSSANAMMQ